MKFLKITAAILFLAILTACNSGQSVQTSETVSETEASTATTSATTTAKTETAASAITTTAAETTTEQSGNDVSDLEFFDISEADKELLKIIADETGLSEEVLLEYARKIDYCMDLFDGGIYDFNGDGVPDFYNSAMDMATSSVWTYDISGRKPEFMWTITAGMKPRKYDEWIKLYYDRKEKKYFYHTATAYILSGDVGFNYIIDCSQINVDFENHSFSERMLSVDSYDTEEKWKAAYEKTEKNLFPYAEEIDTLYTLNEPYLYEENGSYSLRLLHSYFRNNSRRKLAMLLNETGVSGLTFHMTPDEVKKLLGEPKEFIDDTVDFSAVTLKYDNGSLTFVDLAKDGNYQLAFMRLYSFDFCGITENTSRSELISALKDMGIYPEPNFDLFPEIKTLENTDQITAGGDYNGLGISFSMDGDRIEYLTASFVALT